MTVLLVGLTRYQPVRVLRPYPPYRFNHLLVSTLLSLAKILPLPSGYPGELLEVLEPPMPFGHSINDFLYTFSHQLKNS